MRLDVQNCVYAYCETVSFVEQTVQNDTNTRDLFYNEFTNKNELFVPQSFSRIKISCATSINRLVK